MPANQSNFKSQFMAALLGGAVVAVLVIVAFTTGLLKAKGTGGTVVRETPISRPALTGKGNGGDGEATVQQIYKDAAPGVVFIKAQVSGGSQEGPFGLPVPQGRGEATGSGFVIDDQGYVLTNGHVVQEASKIEVGFGDKDFTSAKLVGLDISSDLALVKVDVDKDKLHPLPLGDSKSVSVGDPVVAIGNPFGLDRTVTTGIVSALQRRIEAPNGFQISDVIQTDAAVNPGNSGGPLFDADGKVIGINSQIATAGGGGNVGVAFAIPIDTAKKEISQLKTKGKVAHAYLGITGVGIDKDLTGNLKLPTDKGILVQNVVKDGPAAKAGIKGGDTAVTVNGQDLTLGGDVITKLDDKDVTNMRQLIGIVDSKKPGDDVKVTFLRGKDEKTATVKLGERPKSVDQQQQQQQRPQPQIPSPGQ